MYRNRPPNWRWTLKNSARLIGIGRWREARRSVAKSFVLPCASAVRSIASISDFTTAGVMSTIETLRSLKVRLTTAGCRLVG